MATMPAAAPEIPRPPDGSVIVLEGVPWDTYVALRDAPENYHVHMIFKNGKLELMSPSFRHQREGTGKNRTRVSFWRMSHGCAKSRSST
jgi:hypothetical protein